MNLLPKNTSEFSSQAYWQSFFDKRQKTFEWYSDYKKLSELFVKLIKDKDKILNLGCGNSTLGYDLNQRGCTNIINIDLSELVIKQMQTKYKDYLDDHFKFIKMDLFNLEFSTDDQTVFDVVLDKGTLDALATNASDEIKEKLFKMFNEIERVLNNFGKYICVSLLQEHIVLMLIDWLQNTKYNYIFSVYKLKNENERDDGKSFPVFVFVATKLKRKAIDSKCLFEFYFNEDYNAKPFRTLEKDTVIDLVKEIQNYNLIQNHLKNNSLDDELCIELFDTSNYNEFKYKFIITEQFKRDNKLKFAVFIVPINREKEYLFATKEGRKEICSSASTQRLLFVILNANYKDYPNDSEAIQKELSPSIIEFTPKSYKATQKIPYLTVKDQERELIYESKGLTNCIDYYVYDVKTEESGKELMLRQLIFSCNLALIQSESKLKLVKKKKKLVKTIDHSYLACLHHGAIVSGIALYNNAYFNSLENQLNANLTISNSNSFKVLRILLIGLGGGCFTSFLQHNLKAIDNVRTEFDVVEIDESMVDISKKWFDLNVNLQEKEDKFKIKIIVQDGLVYLKEFKEDHYYNMIIFDIDNQDNRKESIGLSCPPIEFLEQNTLDNVKRLLKRDCLSLFMLNLAARNKTIKKSMEIRLKNNFKQLNKYRIADETNNIYYCFNMPIDLSGIINKEINLSKRIQRFLELFNGTIKKDELSPSIVDACDFCTNLC